MADTECDVVSNPNLTHSPIAYGFAHIDDPNATMLVADSEPGFEARLVNRFVTQLNQEIFRQIDFENDRLRSDDMYCKLTTIQDYKVVRLATRVRFFQKTIRNT